MPTSKQKLAAKKMVALAQKTGGIDKIKAEAMRQAGYSPRTARTPTKLTESKAWPELLEQYLPDEKLLQKHDEALEAVKWNDFTGEKEPDQSIRLKATELGYKLKGKLSETSVLQQFNVGGEMSIKFIGEDEIDSIKQVAIGGSEGQPSV